MNVGDSDSDILIPNSMSEVPEPIPDADPMVVSKISLSCQAFENDEAPELGELASDDEQLQIMADAFHVLLSGEKSIKLSPKNMKDLEFGIRTFAYQVGQLMKQTIAPIPATSDPRQNKQNENVSQVSREDFNKLTKELLKTQQEAADFSNRCKQSENIQNDLRVEIKDLREQGEKDTNLIHELHKKVSDLRRENDAKITSMKQQLDLYQEKNRELTDKSNSSDFAVQRLQRQLEAANSELAQTSAELSLTRSKLESKDMKIETYKQQAQNTGTMLHHAESEIEELKQQNADLITKMESMARELQEFSPEKQQEEQAEHEQITQALAKITSLCEDQSKEISELHKIRAESTSIISKQAQLINELHTRLEETENTMVVKSREIDELSQESEILRSQTQSKIEQEVVDPIKELLREKFGDLDNEGIQEAIKQLIHSADGAESSERNRTLLNIIENQLRFINNLVKSGEMQLFLLSSPEENETLLETQSFKQDIVVESARCRQYILENELALDEDIPNRTEIADEISSIKNNEEGRTHFDIAYFATLSAELIRKMSERIADENRELASRIQESASILQFEGDNIQAADIVVDKLKTFRRFAKTVHDTTEGDFDCNNFDETIESITKFVKRSQEIAKSLELDVKPLINFEGELEEIPSNAALFIRQVLEEINNMQIESVNDMKNQLQELREELASEKETSTNVIARLELENQNAKSELNEAETKLEKAQKGIQTLTQQLEDSKQRKSDLETKLSLLESNYAELEQDAERIRLENENLRKEGIKRQKSYDERIDKLLDEERNAHTQETELMQKKFASKEQKLKEAYESKSAKLSEAKRTMKQMIEQYEAAFVKQKESTAALRAQNQELINRLTNPSASNSSPKKSMKEQTLQSEIKGLQAEKQVLQSRIDQLSNRIEEVQLARDSYWQAQMIAKENEVAKAKNEIEETGKEALLSYVAKVGTIIEQFAPTSFENTEEETLELIQTISERLQEAESKLEASKKKPESPKKENLEIKLQEVTSKATAALKSTAEWEKWAKNLISSILNQEVPNDSKQIRRKISDLALAGIGSSERIIESLRAQKRALINGACSHVKTGKQSVKGLLIAMQASARLLSLCGSSSSFMYPNSYSSLTSSLLQTPVSN